MKVVVLSLLETLHVNAISLYHWAPRRGKIKQLAPGETGQSLQTFQFEAGVVIRGQRDDPQMISF